MKNNLQEQYKNKIKLDVVENEKSLLTSKMLMKNMVMTLHFKSDTSNWKN